MNPKSHIPSTRSEQLQQLSRMFGDTLPSAAEVTFRPAPGTITETPTRFHWRPPSWRDHMGFTCGQARTADVFVIHERLDRTTWARSARSISLLREQIAKWGPEVGVYTLALSVPPARWGLSDVRDFAARMRDVIPGVRGDESAQICLRHNQELEVLASDFAAQVYFTWDAIAVMREWRYQFDDGLLCMRPFSYVDEMLRRGTELRAGDDRAGA